MDPSLVVLGREALLLALWVSLPPLAAALLVGLLVGALQAATQLQDPAVGAVPRFLAVLGALLAAGPWIAARLVRFAAACLGTAAGGPP